VNCSGARIQISHFLFPTESLLARPIPHLHAWAICEVFLHLVVRNAVAGIHHRHRRAAVLRQELAPCCRGAHPALHSSAALTGRSAGQSCPQSQHVAFLALESSVVEDAFPKDSSKRSLVLGFVQGVQLSAFNLNCHVHEGNSRWYPRAFSVWTKKPASAELLGCSLPALPNGILHPSVTKPLN